MANISLTGNATHKFNGRILSDFGNGEVANITFPNELVNVAIGKNGNAIYALNQAGNQADAVLRILRGSGDDKFLNSAFATQKQDLPSTVLATYEFTARLGDGEGNITNDDYLLTGGVFTKHVEVKENVEGDVEQALSIYNLKFTKVIRVIA